MHKFNYQSLWLVLLMLFMGQPTFAQLPASVNGQALPSLAPMLKKAMPAVVNISSARTQITDNPLLNDPFFRHFFNIPEQKKPEKQSRGSGVIIKIPKKGYYVVTNHHVIDKADEISVILQDSRQFNAKVIGTDPETDVALLKIPAEDLTTLSLADSERLQVGDFVVAIGNPFGLGQTATSGIVSALGRSGLGIEGYEDFIQTDASINPGNSGGALVNLRGELVGLNTAILAPGGGNVGIGFAIPSNMLHQVVQHLVEFGEVQRGQLGIKIQDLTLDLAAAFGLKDNKGAVVAEVDRGTPADRAGLQAGDIITAINGKMVDSATDIRNRVGLLRIGERVKITIVRKEYSGYLRTFHLHAVIADVDQTEGGEISLYLDGAVLKDSSDGVQIRFVKKGSNADKVGFQPNDIIIGVNRREAKNIEALTRRFSRYKISSIQIKRNSEILSIWLN